MGAGTGSDEHRQRAYVNFPPRSDFLVLPGRPARAARASLALYDTASPRQRVALVAGALLGRARLLRWLPRNRRSDMDWEWWEGWIATVAEPVVGRVGNVALRMPAHGQYSALLMSASGQPIGFAKRPRRPTPERALAGWRLLMGASLQSFRVPALLAAGEYGGVRYHLLEPLPEGVHRHPPFDPRRVWTTIDEFRGVLEGLAHAQEEPAHYLPCHGDFHPRNLRVASDGSWWLFDLEKIKRGPKLADELRYWSAEFGWRWRRQVTRYVPRILELLRERGSDEDILEAVRWQGSRPRRPAQEAIYAAIERAVDPAIPR